MARGGARKGSGRKKGSLTQRTREIAEKAMADGLSPLQVMLRAMQEHAKADRWDQAADRAKDAAPYMHPRLAAVEHTGANGGPIQTVDLSKLTDEQLRALEPVCSALAAAGDPAQAGEGGDSPEGG